MFSVGWGGDIFSWVHRHSQTKAGDKREHGHRKWEENMCILVPFGG